MSEVMFNKNPPPINPTEEMSTRQCINMSESKVLLGRLSN